MLNSVNLAKVTDALCDRILEVAVVGAGIFGLFAARTLAAHGLRATVFENSRNVGGRISSRRVDGASHFDHGAQCYTVHDERFKRDVDSWVKQCILARQS